MTIAFAPMLMSVAEVEALRAGGVIEIDCRLAEAELAVHAGDRRIGTGAWSSWQKAAPPSGWPAFRHDAFAAGIGIEHGMVRLPRAHLALHGLLMQGPLWLQQVFDDRSLAELGLLPGGGKRDFRCCLLALGRWGALLQVGLLPALFDALDLPQRMPAPRRLARAQQCAAPLLPAPRRFFGQDFELRVEEAPHGWPDTDASVAFQLSVPDLCMMLPVRLADPFVPRLLDVLRRSMGPGRGDVPMRLFAGTRLRLPVSDVLGLQAGDVLLCEDGPAGAARQVRLCTESVLAFREGRYVATLRVHDGRVDHLAPGPWLPAGAADAPRGPRVGVDVVEAWLRVSSSRCRSLAIGQCIDEWRGASWLDVPQVRIGGRPWARVRPVRVSSRSPRAWISAGGSPSSINAPEEPVTTRRQRNSTSRLLGESPRSGNEASSNSLRSLTSRLLTSSANRIELADRERSGQRPYRWALV